MTVRYVVAPNGAIVIESGAAPKGEGLVVANYAAARKLSAKIGKAADARINTAYCRNCSGIQIDIMDIGGVFAEGRRLIAAGADDTALAEGIVAFVQTIRRN